jgi:small subunit ribosomal protein S15
MADKERSTIEKKFAHHDKDTGSLELQVIALTYDIKRLTDHVKANPKDVSSRRGMLAKVSRRTSFLNYIKNKNHELYSSIIDQLGIRK